MKISPIREVIACVLLAAGSRRKMRARPTFTMLFMVAVLASRVTVLIGQTFSDPGFESYDVSAGGFVRPGSGAWLFGNDAGVVEPPAPNTSTGPLNTWSATFDPVDGQQYACTYAALDTIRQWVTFDTAGDYRLSVFAAAPDGSVSIPTVGTVTLGDGGFTFTLGNLAIGTEHLVAAGTGFGLFTADLVVSAPGDLLLGVRNTVAAPYFINYDAFSIQAVPEPSVIALGLIGALGAGLIGLRRRGGRGAR